MMTELEIAMLTTATNAMTIEVPIHHRRLQALWLTLALVAATIRPCLAMLLLIRITPVTSMVLRHRTEMLETHTRLLARLP